MRNPHGAVRRVHALPAVTRRAVHVNPQILRVNLQFDVLRFRQHRHRAGGGLDFAVGLRNRHALHPVNAALVLHARENAAARDAEHGFLDAAQLRLRRRNRLDAEVMPLGIADVHAHQLRREQARFLAARAAANLHDDRMVVVRVARQKQNPQLLLRLGDLRRQRLQFLRRYLVQIRVGQHLLRLLTVAQERLVRLPRRHLLLQRRPFLQVRLIARRVRNDVRLDNRFAQFLIAADNQRVFLKHASLPQSFGGCADSPRAPAHPQNPPAAP